MADDNDAGAAYLSALRQSTKANVGAAAAPARALDPNHPATTLPQKSNSASAEKRKSPRYKCEGSARIQHVGSATATWAKFADISLHGCYVETATPLRAG